MGRRPGVAAAVLACIPRSAAAYGAYILAPMFLIQWRRTPGRAIVAAAILGCLGFGSVLLSGTVATPTVTAWAIELALMAPLLLFAAGFRPSTDVARIITAVRVTQTAVLLMSALSLVQHGFPSRLPYIDMPPDSYSAGFGSGGARIVTVLGFFGAVVEMRQRQTGQGSRWALAASLANFFLPSYIQGIVCGLAAWGVTRARRPAHVIGVLALAAPSLWYAVSVRLANVNTVLATSTGENPKVLAYEVVGGLYRSNPKLAFFGTGPGQFSSIPQTWVDPGIRSISVNSVPSIPGLRESLFHIQHIDPLTNIAFTSRYALGSSISKPYTGLSTMLAEWGALGTIVIVALLWRRCRTYRDRAVWCGFIFAAALNVVDTWNDSPWLAFGLIALAGLAGADQSRSMSPTLATKAAPKHDTAAPPATHAADTAT